MKSEVKTVAVGSDQGIHETTNPTAEETSIRAPAPFKIGPLGLDELTDECTFDDMTKIIEECDHTEDREAAADSEAFIVGDAAAAAAEKFGEDTLKEWAEKRNKNYATLRNRKRIAEAIPMKLRKEFTLRSDRIKYNHFVEVAVFRIEETKRKWLDDAIKNDWTARELGRQIKKAKEAANPPKPKVTIPIGETVVADVVRTVNFVGTQWKNMDPGSRSTVVVQAKKLADIVAQMMPDKTGKPAPVSTDPSPSGETAPALAGDALEATEHKPSAPLEKPAKKRTPKAKPIPEVMVVPATTGATEVEAAAPTPKPTPALAADVAAAVNPAQVMAGMSAMAQL